MPQPEGEELGPDHLRPEATQAGEEEDRQRGEPRGSIPLRPIRPGSRAFDVRYLGYPNRAGELPLHRFEIAQTLRDLLSSGRRLVLDEVVLHANLPGSL